MKKNFLRALMAVALAWLSAAAFAQCVNPHTFPEPTVYDSSRGCRVPMGTPPVGAGQLVYNQPAPQYVQSPYSVPRPVYSSQYGQQPYYGGAPVGGGLSNCAVVGGLAGGTLGSLAKHHRGQAVILGALIGGVVGQWVCTNSAGQRVIVQQQLSTQVAAPVLQSGQHVYAPPIPAEQQVGGYATTTVRRTVGEPSDCDIGHIPGLQDIKNLSREQCQAIRDALRVSKPGHCRVGGVDYPELVDNEPGCLAKLSEATAQGAHKAGKMEGPVPADQVKVDSSKGTPLADVCAWVHPDTKKRFDKPADFAGSCLDFVKKVAGHHGFSVAVRQ